MLHANWETLTAKIAEVRDIGAAVALLSWDQETYMPPKGLSARAEQLATLQGLQHERLLDHNLGDALAKVKADGQLTPTQRAIVREFEFDRERAIKVPLDLVKEIAKTQALALSSWGEARGLKRFASFAPDLARLVELRRRMADAYGAPPAGERYDALLEGHEKGMRVARLVPLFKSLSDWLVPAIQKIAECPAHEAKFLQGQFAADRQWDFANQLLQAMGFDFQAGRMDKSVHPFTTSFDPHDVRITVRIFEDLPLSSAFSTIHEAGHALYEQGLPVEHRRLSLCAAASMGLHESQSRLWENLVGRSLAFWTALFPRYREVFPAQLGSVSLADFYAAVNQVSPSMIRVEADEVTYNLHIVIRFELELALLRDELTVTELPGAWHELYRKYLGVAVPDDSAGVLQDIHWAWGEFGYFPTYTIGNLYSATLLDAATRDIPTLWTLIQAGDLSTLRHWLGVHVHALGRVHDAEEIVRLATGKGLAVDDFIDYLRNKYGPLYGVTL